LVKKFSNKPQSPSFSVFFSRPLIKPTSPRSAGLGPPFPSSTDMKKFLMLPRCHFSFSLYPLRESKGIRYPFSMIPPIQNVVRAFYGFPHYSVQGIFSQRCGRWAPQDVISAPCLKEFLHSVRDHFPRAPATLPRHFPPKLQPAAFFSLSPSGPNQQHFGSPFAPGQETLEHAPSLAQCEGPVPSKTSSPSVANKCFVTLPLQLPCATLVQKVPRPSGGFSRWSPPSPSRPSTLGTDFSPACEPLFADSIFFPRPPFCGVWPKPPSRRWPPPLNPGVSIFCHHSPTPSAALHDTRASSTECGWFPPEFPTKEDLSFLQNWSFFACAAVPQTPMAYVYFRLSP